MENAKTVWLLGAGFSKPLGGPLFADLISLPTERWVRAWVARLAKSSEPQGAMAKCRVIYEKGKRTSLWRDAEQCISHLDTARKDPHFAAVLQEALQDAEPPESVPPQLRFMGPIDIERCFAEVTQFVAAATGRYVPDDPGSLPEVWRPYEHWAATLSADDTVLSFNYDRVVERLGKPFTDFDTTGQLFKLHGTTPTAAELAEHLNAGTCVGSIAVPGPSKLRASENPIWEKAAAALREAQRLVVIGYSFPASDAAARSFVLKNFKGSQLAIVVGDDTAGAKIQSTFRHLGKGVVNTGLVTEAYLTEGTARSQNGRFMHEILWPERGEVISAPSERWGRR